MPKDKKLLKAKAQKLIDHLSTLVDDLIENGAMDKEETNYHMSFATEYGKYVMTVYFKDHTKGDG